jgi:hypothetical protein
MVEDYERRGAPRKPFGDAVQKKWRARRAAVLPSTPTTNPPPSTLLFVESGKRDSNPRPQPWQGCALPTELFPQSVSHLESRHARTRSDHKSQRVHMANVAALFRAQRRRGVPRNPSPRHGGEGNRTPDLLNAIQALSQLSYAPSSQLSSGRLSPGTTKYSHGYSECQQIGTGENLFGRYFAAPYVTWLIWSKGLRGEAAAYVFSVATRAVS